LCAFRWQVVFCPKQYHLIVRRHRASVDAVQADGDWLNQRCQRRVKVADRIERGGSHCDSINQRAGNMGAQHSQPRAAIGATMPARVARSTWLQRLDRDPVSHTHRSVIWAGEGFDDTGELMSLYNRVARIWVLPQVQEQVRATESDRFDADKGLAQRHRRFRLLLHDHLPWRHGDNCSHHFPSPGLLPDVLAVSLAG
jgi:hypothetical protein